MHFLCQLHSNAILTGAVDSYCLVCDDYLRSEDEAFMHFDKPIHRKNIVSAVRAEKFLDDKIIKVKKGYYCTFCNILLSTTPKVSIHIVNPNHINNKRSQLSYTGNTIVAFDEVAITYESWHGIKENTCNICNEEIEDVAHSKDKGHMLRLIQSNCEFGDRFVYRKIDDDTFFCLICGDVFAIDDKLGHHESSSHRQLYNTGKELKKKIPSPQSEVKAPKINNNIENEKVETEKAVQLGTNIKKTETPETKKTEITRINNDVGTKQECKNKLTNEKSNIATNHSTDKPITNETMLLNRTPEKKVNDEMVNSNDNLESNILDRVVEFQKKGININFTLEIARCKICNENIAFDTVSIEKHIEVHNQTKAENDSVLKKEADKLENNKKIIQEAKPQHVKNEHLKKSKPKQHKKEDRNGIKAKKVKLPNDAQSKAKKEQQNQTNKADSSNKSVKVPTKQTEKDLATVAQENDMVLLPEDTYCLVCKVSTKSTIPDITAHSNLESHKENVKNKSPLIKKLTSIEYIESIVQVESNLGSELIVNDKIALKQNSFHCILTDEETFECLLCDMKFSRLGHDCLGHMNDPAHKDKLGKALVVTTRPEEFVREINHNTFHCGYCNEVCSDWAAVEHHLTTAWHEYARRHAQWNLLRCHAITKQSRLVKVASLLAVNYA